MLHKLFPAPTVAGATARLHGAMKGLERAQAHHEAQGRAKRDTAFRLQDEAGLHAAEVIKAGRIRARLEELLS